MRTQSASLIAVVTGGLIGLLLTRVSKRTKDNQRPRPDLDDPRWGPGDGRVQIAGKTCPACNERIAVATEGIACGTCRCACHTKCIARHVAQAHKAHDDGTPYR
jgi:hypothetical protein